MNDDEYDERVQSKSDEELGFLAIKEENTKKRNCRRKNPSFAS